MLQGRRRGDVLFECSWMLVAMLGTTFFALADAAVEGGGTVDVGLRALERLGCLGIVAWLVWHNNAKREPAQVLAAQASLKSHDDAIERQRASHERLAAVVEFRLHELPDSQKRLSGG